MIGLGYFTCPRQVGVCGSKEVITVNGGSGDAPTTLEYFAADWGIGSLVNGEVCRYRLIFPLEARKHDEIRVQVSQLANAVAYFVETP